MTSNEEVKFVQSKKPTAKRFTKFKIKIDSDSEDNLTIISEKEYETNKNGKNNQYFESQKKEEIIDMDTIVLDENKTNIKSNSKSSVSTTISHSNCSSNKKNIPAALGNFDISKVDISDMLTISSGTKRTLEKIREKRKLAKIDKIMLAAINKTIGISPKYATLSNVYVVPRALVAPVIILPI